jgi:hypothetical protein
VDVTVIPVVTSEVEVTDVKAVEVVLTVLSVVVRVRVVGMVSVDVSMTVLSVTVDVTVASVEKSVSVDAMLVKVWVVKVTVA